MRVMIWLFTVAMTMGAIATDQSIERRSLGKLKIKIPKGEVKGVGKFPWGMYPLWRVHKYKGISLRPVPIGGMALPPPTPYAAPSPAPYAAPPPAPYAAPVAAPYGTPPPAPYGSPQILAYDANHASLASSYGPPPSALPSGYSSIPPYGAAPASVPYSAAAPSGGENSAGSLDSGYDAPLSQSAGHGSDSADSYGVVARVPSPADSMKGSDYESIPMDSRGKGHLPTPSYVLPQAQMPSYESDSNRNRPPPGSSYTAPSVQFPQNSAHGSSSFSSYGNDPLPEPSQGSLLNYPQSVPGRGSQQADSYRGSPPSASSSYNGRQQPIQSVFDIPLAAPVYNNPSWSNGRPLDSYSVPMMSPQSYEPGPSAPSFNSPSMSGPANSYGPPPANVFENPTMYVESPPRNSYNPGPMQMPQLHGPGSPNSMSYGPPPGFVANSGPMISTLPYGPSPYSPSHNNPQTPQRPPQFEFPNAISMYSLPPTRPVMSADSPISHGSPSLDSYNGGPMVSFPSYRPDQSTMSYNGPLSDPAMTFGPSQTDLFDSGSASQSYGQNPSASPFNGAMPFSSAVPNSPGQSTYNGQMTFPSETFDQPMQPETSYGRSPNMPPYNLPAGSDVQRDEGMLDIRNSGGNPKQAPYDSANSQPANTETGVNNYGSPSDYTFGPSAPASQGPVDVGQTDYVRNMALQTGQLDDLDTYGN